MFVGFIKFHSVQEVQYGCGKYMFRYCVKDVFIIFVLEALIFLDMNVPF
jgi:hypothetical protein